MSLVQAAQQMRMLEHEGELALAVPTELCGEEETRKCIVCEHFIDAHPGRGRKPLLCGRVRCRRSRLNELRMVRYWRRKNARTRLLMAMRFAGCEAPQAPETVCALTPTHLPAAENPK